jgi:hypothetical protein
MRHLKILHKMWDSSELVYGIETILCLLAAVLSLIIALREHALRESALLVAAISNVLAIICGLRKHALQRRTQRSADKTVNRRIDRITYGSGGAMGHDIEDA